jgi:hypothetical protein
VRWATCMTEVTTPDKAWALVMSGEVDFQSNVVLESDRDGSIPEAQGDCVDDSSNTPAISLQESGPNKLDISVQALNDGWIVLSDVWYPGWRAWVDGQPVRIYHANYLFRAVYVGAGEHVIEFRYQPISFWLGACISIVGICLLAILWHRFRSSHG